MPLIAKRHVGRTSIARTPLRIRSTGVHLTTPEEERMERLLRRRLARFGTFLERIDLRFEDINGPRGGADTIARIQLSVAGRPPIFVEERAVGAGEALARAASSVARAMDRTTGKHGLRAPAPTHAAAARGAARRTASRARIGERTRPAARRAPRRRGMVYKLEESATKPSRKSTRKSANRMKGASRLSRRTRRAKQTPRSRAARAESQRRRARAGR